MSHVTKLIMSHASDVGRYNNPIYKLMTSNEQTATGVN